MDPTEFDFEHELQQAAVNSIAVVHQAYFLPWLGYFNKLAYASRFVVLDNVQYCIRDYHNRARIKNMHGIAQWVTLPVGKGNYGAKANQVKVLQGGLDQVFRTIHYSYAGSKYYGEYWPKIRAAIEEGYPDLLRININSIRALLHILCLDSVSVSLASDYYQGSDATDRLIVSCHAVGAKQMIMGEVSWRCHDLNRIASSGIELERQVFLRHHPVYPQINGSFVSGLSTLDALFNVGAEETLRLAKSAWTPNNGSWGLHV